MSSRTLRLPPGVSSLLSSLSRSLPSKPPLIHKIVRVDHAGELAADRIYAGQMAVLGKTECGPSIKKMWEEEKNHLDEMERLSAKYSVPLSLFSPVFSIAGYVLGASSALAGKEGAMGCTVAVEELIGSHYNEQIKELLEKAPEEKELLGTLSKLRDDELHHLHVGKDQGGEKSTLFSPLKMVVQGGCKVAIAIAERV